jgi:ribosome-associated translation inhibitor RaiA
VTCGGSFVALSATVKTLHVANGAQPHGIPRNGVENTCSLIRRAPLQNRDTVSSRRDKTTRYARESHQRKELMQIDIIGQRLRHSPALWAHAEVRFRQALGRFAERIERVTVRLNDANGHRGGVDKVCSVELLWDRGDPLIAEAIDADPYVAVDLTASKLKRAVLRSSRLRWERPRRSGWLAM